MKICKHCGKEIKKPLTLHGLSIINWKRRKFCSRKCYSIELKKRYYLKYTESIKKKTMDRYINDRNNNSPAYLKRLKRCNKYQKERPELARKAQRIQRIINPEKIKARQIINNLIRGGYIQNPKLLKCCRCKKQATEYHHKDYTKPLEVKPICRRCHSLDRRTTCV